MKSLFFITLAGSLCFASAYNKYCQNTTDCDEPGSYCMNGVDKQPVDVFYCHGDNDYCRGDGDCEPGDYCLNDPAHAPLKRYMCKAQLKHVEARVVLSAEAKDWCYAQASTNKAKCEELVKMKKCTWYEAKDGSGKCITARSSKKSHSFFYYHVLDSGDNQCYQTRYIDANYKNQGYVFSRCPSKYSKLTSVNKVQICAGHSEINVKDCKTKVISIKIQKLGIASKDDKITNQADSCGSKYKTQSTCDAASGCVWCKCAALPSACWTTADAKKLPSGVYDCGSSYSTGDVKYLRKFHAGRKWHLSSKTDNQCYETTYFDDNFSSKGFRRGACSSVFNKVLSVNKEQVCAGHSETNLKDCKSKIITISITKKGQQ